MLYTCHLTCMEWRVSPLPTPTTGDLAGKSSRDSALPLWPVRALTLLTLRLWHFAIAIFHDIIVISFAALAKKSLASMSCLLAACREQIGMMALRRQLPLCFSLDVTNSRRDSDESIDATCISPRLDSTHLSSGWDLRSPTFTIICDNHDRTSCGGRCSDMGI